MTALTGLKIVELAERPAGEYCGKLLSDFGAEVIKIERPERGSPTRAMAPMVKPGPEGSGLFAYLNTNKKSAVLDLASEAGREDLRKLIAAADVVIDDHDEGWLKAMGLAPEDAERDFPSTIICSITRFGRGAPRSWWNAQSLNIFQRSGWGYHTPMHPDLSKPPLKGPGRFVVDYEAAIDAALCILSTVVWRRRSGQGQFIDVSELEVMVGRADWVVNLLVSGDMRANNARTAYDDNSPIGFYACSDGFVYLYISSKTHWARLKTLMGNPEWANKYDDNWLLGATDEQVADCRARFAEWVRPLKKREVAAQAQAIGDPLVTAVNEVPDLYESPQFVFRKFFQRLKHPILGEALYPTVPYIFSASPAKLVTPAPQLGQHTAEVHGRVDKAKAQAATPRSDSVRSPSGGPLAGIRVLELTKVWAGPYAAKLLAYLGAEVIKIESFSNMDSMRGYPDPKNYDETPIFLAINAEVKSVAVNLKSEDGLKYVREMIAKSDIVMNNIRPGAMERTDLGYEQMRAIKRDIISVSLKMYGNDGPLNREMGYAPCFAALGGLNNLVGYEGGPPVGISGRYGDTTAGAVMALAAIIALVHREQTGEGQFVDVSAVEALSTLIGDRLLEYGLTGKLNAREGNAHADMAPHNCYPCREAAWLSIAVTSDEEWRKLCEVLGKTELANDQRFVSLAGRWTQRAVLDEILSGLTKDLDAVTLAQRLRAAGVPAFKSASSLDLVNDEYLWGRNFFRSVSDRTRGLRPVAGPPWRMSHTSASISRGAPKIGADNAYVYCDLLGLSREKLEELVRQKAAY